MTMTDSPTPPRLDPAVRRLRRSTSDRVGAGVAGGLGEYFGVDPVLFRVLFATAAFFGGAGILGYLLAWAVIPDVANTAAPVDRWLANLRSRRGPVWVVTGAAGLVLWFVAFSWWAPGTFWSVGVGVALLVVMFGRRDARARAITDASARRRERLRRALPVKIATLTTLITTLAVLAAVDAVHGIELQVYFWAALGILAVGLLVGAALRRPAVSTAILVAPALAGVIAFAGSDTSLHDGTGDRQWRPTTVPAGAYRLAFGQGVLDLRSLAPQTSPRIVRVTVGAGHVHVLAPRTARVTVQANVRFGRIDLDGGRLAVGNGLSREILPPALATGAQITVDVHLADGYLDVSRR